MSQIVIFISPSKAGIGRLEIKQFDDLLLRHELHKPGVLRVGVGSRLDGRRWLVVRQQDPKWARGREDQNACTGWSCGDYHSGRNIAREAFTRQRCGSSSVRRLAREARQVLGFT